MKTIIDFLLGVIGILFLFLIAYYFPIRVTFWLTTILIGGGLGMFIGAIIRKE